MATNGSSVKFKLHKDTRQYSKKVYTDSTKTVVDESKSVKNPNYKKWNARAIHANMIGIDEIAEEMQQSCSLTKSDIKGCIEQLIVNVGKHLRNSDAVRLDGFGIFKVGLKTSYADTMDDFSVTTNIKGSRINFTPAYTVNTMTNVRTVALLEGMKASETPKNANL